jgi:hypothetical protein
VRLQPADCCQPNVGSYGTLTLLLPGMRNDGLNGRH